MAFFSVVQVIGPGDIYSVHKSIHPEFKVNCELSAAHDLIFEDAFHSVLDVIDTTKIIITCAYKRVELFIKLMSYS